ncbi:MAG: DUF4032 domain-containing protein [Chloroflexi bacterium]|nr:DUF4032 domain-containing protein [Chloroflexota bacterium]
MTNSAPSALLDLRVRPGAPDFLDLPWHAPLAEWPAYTARLVQVQRGISRHEVVFVNYDDAIYAVKELPPDIAEREYQTLRAMESARLPVVSPVGHAHVRHTEDGEAASVLITRYLDGSLPYRLLFMRPGLARYRNRLLGTIAGLLVRLHLAGFYWGDCSLSNTLFRRDADALQAYVVDAETSEMHETLSKGQRQTDLMIMEENVSGELGDLAALMERAEDLDVYDTGRRIIQRYEQLWKEITREEVIAPTERYRIRERVRALNNLGFWVDEIELLPTADGSQLKLRAIVADRNYHARQLHRLTAIRATDVQAKHILNDIYEYRASLQRELNRSVPLSNAAYRWLEEVYSPTVRKLAPLIDSHSDVPELYCEVLEHKWFMSEQARHDVGMEPAIADYIEWARLHRPADSEPPDDDGGDEPPL